MGRTVRRRASRPDGVCVARQLVPGRNPSRECDAL